MIRQIPDYFFGICSKMGSKNCIKRFRMSSLRWWYFRLKIQAVSKIRAKRKIIHKQMGQSSNQHDLFSLSHAQVSHPSTKAAAYIIISVSRESRWRAWCSQTRRPRLENCRVEPITVMYGICCQPLGRPIDGHPYAAASPSPKHKNDISCNGVPVYCQASID